MKLYSGRS